MKIFLKILFSVIYPCILLVLFAMAFTIYENLTASHLRLSIKTRLCLNLITSLLPIFYYSLWNKIKSIRIKALQFATGSLISVFLSIFSLVVGDMIILSTFNITIFNCFNIMMIIAIFIIPITVARSIARKTCLRA